MTTQDKISLLKKLLIYQKEILANEVIIADSEKILKNKPNDDLILHWIESARRSKKGYELDYENALLLLTEEKESVL